MRSLALGCVLVFSQVSATAAAAPRLTAERAVARGQRFMEKGEYASALSLFVAAYDDAPYPRTLAQVAIAEQSLGRWKEAEQHFLKVLSSHDDPWVEKNRIALERCLRGVSAQLGKLILTSQPPSDAIVRVNGQEFPPAEAASPITVLAGRTTIEVRAPGYEPFVSTIDVAGASMVNVTLALQRITPPAPPVVEKRLELPPAPPPPPRRTWPKVLGGTLVAGGLGGVATGIVLLLRDGTCASDPVTSPGGERGICLKLWDTKVEGIVTTSVGAAAALAGGVVLWRSFSEPAAPSVQLSWSNGPVGSLVGRF